METKDQHPDEPTTPDVSQVRNPEVRHEPTDVGGGGILGFAIGLMAATVVIYVLIYWLYESLSRKRLAERLPPPRPLVTSPAFPGEPPLQGTPAYMFWGPEEVRALHAEEDLLLNYYGWADRASGRARIPIREAMKLLAAEGLPARQQAPRPEESPLRSSSGRVLDKVHP